MDESSTDEMDMEVQLAFRASLISSNSFNRAVYNTDPSKSCRNLFEWLQTIK